MPGKGTKLVPNDADRLGAEQVAACLFSNRSGRNTEVMSDYVKPEAMVVSMIESGRSKATLPAVDLLIRGALAGAYLAFVTSMALLIAAQTGKCVVGALLFPAGFALIVVLKLELLTGN